MGSYPYFLAYDNGKGQVFVANGASNNVSVINDTTNRVVASIAVRSQPDGVVYDWGKGEVFVANSISNNVSVISDSSDEVLANISVATAPLYRSYPTGVAYDSGKGEVFVAGSSSNSISVINDTTNRVTANISGTAIVDPWGVVYDSGKGEVFVADNDGGMGIGNVSVINDSTNSVISNISVGVTAGPIAVAYDSAMSEVFVADYDSGNVSVISDTTNAVVATIPVGTNPYGLAYDSGIGAIFVANLDGNVSVVDDRTNTVVATIPLGAGSNTGGAAYDSGRGELYVTSAPSSSGMVFAIPTNLSLESALIPSRTSIDVGQPDLLNTSTIATPSSYSYTYSSPASAGCTASRGPSVICTPIAPGNYTITVTITDSFGNVGNAGSGVVRVYPSLSASATVSNATLWLGDTVVITGNASGGLSPYTYNFTGLPPGCVPQGTNRIGCLPTQSGNYTIRFVLSDANNWSVSSLRALSITFDFIIVAPSSATVGSLITLRVDSAPGIGTLTYSYSNLPPGCANQDVSTLRCTPTAVGVYSIQVSVHDQVSDHNSHTIVLNVVQAPVRAPVFLGFPGAEGYYLLAILLGGVCVAIVASSARSRSKRLTAKIHKLEFGANARYRAAAEEPGQPDVQLLSEGETDPASDLF